MKRIAIITTLIILIYPQITFSGTWRDDFEDKNTKEWTIFNEDPVVEDWWIKNGEAVGEIFLEGFMSLWLTGDLEWENYSVACRAKMVKDKKGDPYIGLTLHDRGEEDARYLFYINFNSQMAVIAKATPDGWSVVPFPFVVEKEKWYEIKATVNNGQLDFQIDDQIFGAIDPEPLKGGQAGLIVSDCRANFDDVEISGDNIPDGGPGKPRAIDLRGKMITTWSKIKNTR